MVILVGGNGPLIGGDADDLLIASGNGNSMDGGAGNDVLIGLSGNDLLQGGSGDDELRAGAGNDTLEGDAGRDRLQGGAGNDTYIYRIGDGIDRIGDSGGDTGDMIAFGSGITPASLVLTASSHGEEVVVTFAGGNAGDAIILSGQLFAQQAGIDGFTFADGTVWSRADMLSHIAFAPVAPLNQAGTSADETILGGFGDDTLGGGAGTDLLKGGFGSDSYQFNLGDGHDEIADQGSILDVDTLVFGSGITAASLTLTRSLADPSKLTLGVNAADSVTITVAGNGWGDGIERVVFADGTVRTIVDLERQYLAAAQTTGNDILIGFDNGETVDTAAGNDTLAGGRGDDFLKGGAGNETYRFNLGDGRDIISDTGGTDALQFGAGVRPEDIRIAISNTNSNSLILSLPDARDGITLHNQLSSSNTIEQFAFSDGTVWTSAQLLDRFKTLSQTEANDRIVGFATNDTLNGGGGDDRIYGGSGNDTLGGGTGNDTLADESGNDAYAYNPGDGNDLIIDDFGTDRVTLGSGITPADVVLTRSIGDENDLRISFQGMAGSITVQDQFYSSSKGIDEIGFADGTVWSAATIRSTLIASTQTEGNDRVVGFAANDTLSGGLGDDRLYGWAGNDTLAGGAGNDTLVDDSGNETYTYNPGDGDDLIIDNAGTDRVVLGAGISPLDVVVTQGIGDQYDLKISFLNAAGSITVQDQFYSTAKGIDEIGFADGTVWSRTYIQTLATLNSLTTTINGTTLADTILGTPLNDRIFANAGNDVIRGGAGNDTIEGYSGNDRYLFDRGDGQDMIYGFSGTDSLEFGSGIAPSDITVTRDPNNMSYCVLKIAGGSDQVTISGVPQVKFADGTVWTEAQVHQRYADQAVSEGRDFIYASFDSAGLTFNAGAGDDRIYAGTGADIIRGGTGNDTIEGGAGNDRYLFDRGDGQDMIYNAGGSDSLEFGAGIAPTDILVERDPNNATYCILKIAGTTDQVAISAIGQVKFQDGTVWTEAQVHQRYVDQTVSEGRDFIDVSIASAAMTVNAGAGDDRIYAGAGGDVIRGGTGNDYAEGGAGNDRYLFNLGDGQDVIYDQTGTADTLEFGAGIDPSDVTVRQDPTNTSYLVLSIAGTGDQVSIQGIDTILFANGTNWTVSTLPVEPLLAGTGVVKLYGDSLGNQLIGTSGDDIFTGKAGNDVLLGSSGSDVFNFARGDGRDTIIDDGAISFTDALVLGAGIAPSDVLVQSVANHPNDLLLIIKGADDAIYLTDQLAGNGSGLEQVRFADGTVWTRTNLVATDPATQTTSGNDLIYGTIFADTLAGGLGNDVLKGGLGSDVYSFNAGDGQDTIVDQGGLAADNTLSFGTGLLAANLLAQRLAPDSGDLILRFAGSADQVTLTGQFSGGGVASVAFHDGTILDRAAIQALVLSQATTAGADVINGFASDDTLRGGLGNDTLNGGAGGDSYIYASGDGNDLIDEALNSGTDTLHLTNLNAANVSFAAAADDPSDLIVTVTATGETIRIDDQFATTAGSNSGIDQIAFADGTTWTMSAIAAATTFSFTGTAGQDTMNGGAYGDRIDGAAGNDTISGNAGNDTIIGGLGNDVLNGGAGSDTFVFRPGDGLDSIGDFNIGAAEGDVIRLEGFGYQNLSDVLAHAYQSAGNTVITFDAGHTLTLTGVVLTDLHDNNFVFASA